MRRFADRNARHDTATPGPVAQLPLLYTSHGWVAPSDTIMGEADFDEWFQDVYCPMIKNAEGKFEVETSDMINMHAIREVGEDRLVPAGAGPSTNEPGPSHSWSSTHPTS